MVPVIYRRNDLPKENALRVIAAMVESGEFLKSSRGSILWEQSPDVFNPLSRSEEIADVIQHADLFSWEGDPLLDREWLPLARAIESLRWRLPACPETRYLPNAKREIRQRAVRS